MDLQNDIYFDSKFASLYLDQNDKLFEFRYEEKENVFCQLAIKRPIQMIGSEQVCDGLFDLETPYGYGGFYTNSNSVQFVEKAFELYRRKCAEENIVAEFIRFHPFGSFTEKFRNKFDFFSYDRPVIVVNLLKTKEERWKEYAPKTRNVLRKADKCLKFGESSNLDEFISIYYSTMKKNKAAKSYFFERGYFEKLAATPGVKLFQVSYDETAISMAFFIFGQDIAHYHLSGNNYEFANMSGNYFLLDCLFDYSRARGLKFANLGGGSDSAEDNTLLRFKKKFSKDSRRFEIGGIVHDKIKFEEYNSCWEKQEITGGQHFLKYRLPSD